MNLELSPEQQALAESLDRLLSKLSDPERVREVEGHGGFDAELWRAQERASTAVVAFPRTA